MSIKEFEKRANEAIVKLRSWNREKVTFVFHDDADGLCSAAITKTFLQREGFEADGFCLEKVYPEVIENLHKAKNKIIFYCDIGSSHADFISSCNKGNNLVIILDHHDFANTKDKLVFDLNLERFGFKGETDFSSSTVCYLFSKLLKKENLELSYLALIGSIEIPSGFKSINKEVMEEALKNGIVEEEGRKLIVNKFKSNIQDVFSALQILGPVGYYQNGPMLGIELCLNGFNDEIRKKVNELEEKRKEANKKIINELLKNGLNQTKHLQWFDAHDIYKDMGTKVIGTFCSYLSYQRRLIKPFKYILGFTNMRNDIPGFGELKQRYVKVSMRAPKAMQIYIQKKKLPSAVELLKKACEKMNGIADGHEFAASAVIPSTKKEELILEMESFFTPK